MSIANVFDFGLQRRIDDILLNKENKGWIQKNHKEIKVTYYLIHNRNSNSRDQHPATSVIDKIVKDYGIVND